MFWKHLNVIFTILISLVFIAAQSVRFFVATVVVLIVVFVRIKIFGPKAAMRRSKTKEISIETDRNVVRQVMSKFEILQSNKHTSEIQKYINFAQEGLKYRYKEKYMQTISYDGSVFLIHILRALVIGGV
jgi:ABC-type multidrug transport system fused ATPase/permease subunit